MVIRIIAIAVVLWGFWFFYKFLKANLAKPKNACPRCDGNGYYEVVRGRENCKQCNGTGIYIG